MWKKVSRLSLILGVLAMFGLFFGPLAQAQDYDEPIKIGWTAWSDAEAVTKMAKKILEDEMGYDVELVMADIGVQYQGLEGGDIDIMLMSWLPVTHQNYWDKYAKNLDNLGPIYTRARLGWVVPDYVPEDQLSSIEDLKDSDVADKLGNEIIGIDPGAGLMQASEEAMEDYELDNYDLISSSGSGMTSAISRAERRDEWIVATGWSPHWKFAAWDLRYLEDPEGVLGGKEKIHAMARDDFYQDVPYEVYEFFTRFYMPLDELQEVMYEARESSYEEAIDKYLKNNPKRVDYWVTGQFD
ncbi:MAG: glycine betaine ABC transporter substrate-binding protein [Desulfohalobiaceae bacterium]